MIKYFKYKHIKSTLKVGYTLKSTHLCVLLATWIQLIGDELEHALHLFRALHTHAESTQVISIISADKTLDIFLTFLFAHVKRGLVLSRHFDMSK